MVAIPNVGGGGFMLGETFLKEKGRQDALALERQRLALSLKEVNQRSEHFYAQLAAQKEQAASAAGANLGRIRNAGAQQEFADAGRAKAEALAAQIHREDRDQAAQIHREDRDIGLQEKDTDREQRRYEFEVSKQTEADKLIQADEHFDEAQRVNEKQVDLNFLQRKMDAEEKIMARKDRELEKEEKAERETVEWKAKELTRVETAKMKTMEAQANRLEANAAKLTDIDNPEVEEQRAAMVKQAMALRGRIEDTENKLHVRLGEFLGQTPDQIAAIAGEKEEPGAARALYGELAEKDWFIDLSPEGRAAYANARSLAAEAKAKADEAQANKEKDRALREQAQENTQASRAAAEIRKVGLNMARPTATPDAALDTILKVDQANAGDPVLMNELRSAGSAGPGAKAWKFYDKVQENPDTYSRPEALERQIRGMEKLDALYKERIDFLLTEKNKSGDLRLPFDEKKNEMLSGYELGDGAGGIKPGEFLAMLRKWKQETRKRQVQEQTRSMLRE